MVRRSRGRVIMEGSLPSPVFEQKSQAAANQSAVPSAQDQAETEKLLPATSRLLSLFRQIDSASLFSDEELDRICRLTAGDRRRSIQRLLVGVYRRSLEKKDGDGAQRARVMLTLHEAEKLEESLKLGVLS